MTVKTTPWNIRLFFARSIEQDSMNFIYALFNTFSTILLDQKSTETTSF